MADTTQTVEIGEITVQYTAAGTVAKDEIAEFKDELRDMIEALERANAVGDMASLHEFDLKLAWDAE